MVCYHQHACEALGDIAIDLVDYCARRIGNLSRGAWFRETEPAPKSAKDLAADAENQTAGTELTKNARDVEFNASVIAVAVLRFLTQYVESLPITCLNRLIDTHDVLVAIVPLVENPPWTRCFETGEWQKLVDLKWTTVPNEELLTLTKLEAQCWLTVHHLLCNREVRARYHFNTFRQGQLLRLRRYLNEVRCRRSRGVAGAAVSTEPHCHRRPASPLPPPPRPLPHRSCSTSFPSWPTCSGSWTSWPS